MNKVERLAELVGSATQLAQIIGRNKSIVTRMVKAGKVRPEFNPTIRAWVASANMGGEATRAILKCLEPDICPCCGQPMPAGQVV